MAVFDVKQTTNEGVSLPWPGDKTFVMKRIVDFSVAANKLATDKIMALFNVPAFVLVKEVGFRVITVDALMATSCYLGAYTETSAGVITVVDEDGFAADAIFTVAGYVTPDVDAAYMVGGSGKQGYKSTADWVLTFTNKDSDTCAVAKVEFYAICVDLR